MKPSMIPPLFLKKPRSDSTPGKVRKKTSRGVTLVNGLTRLHKEGAFKEEAIDLDKTMFHLDTHPRYIGIPQDFSEPSLYTKTMTCLAMGITVKQFVELCGETLDKKAVRVLVMEIGGEIKAKMGSLEVVYMIRNKGKKDGSGHGVSTYGRRFKILKTAMSVQLKGNANARRKIDKHSGLVAASAARSMAQ